MGVDETWHDKIAFLQLMQVDTRCPVISILQNFFHILYPVDIFLEQVDCTIDTDHDESSWVCAVTYQRLWIYETTIESFVASGTAKGGGHGDSDTLSTEEAHDSRNVKDKGEPKRPTDLFLMAARTESFEIR